MSFQCFKTGAVAFTFFILALFASFHNSPARLRTPMIFLVGKAGDYKQGGEEYTLNRQKENREGQKVIYKGYLA